MKICLQSCLPLIVASMILFLPSCKEKPSAAVKDAPKVDQPTVTVPSDCQSMTSSFSSNDEAKEAIQKTEFKMTDSITESNSAWIGSAHFYSCDEQTGYFILVTDQQEYMHAGITVDMWNDFKAATSHGAFYNAQIRDRYLLPVKE